MTAVASPLTFQPNTRLGWSANGTTGFGTMNSDEVSKMMFSTAPPRKTVQRQNSASSISSTTSTATITAAPPVHQTNGVAPSPPTVDAGSYTRKKPIARGIWPQGKGEPATGISIARPQAVSSAATGPTASSAISALHAPLLPSQQMANGNGQVNGASRNPAPSEPTALLHLSPMNGTFERKAICVPYLPEMLRVGRQTNQKTIPTPLNGYFDSKVLSRQHAEVWADRQGRIFIRDVKSSNGTFVNGLRLSQENKESEPRELREQDVLELGIDIVSEDQKTVVHHKVAAKVEYAGIYAEGSDSHNFGSLDPNSNGSLIPGAQQLKRSSSQDALNGRRAVPAPGINQAGANMGAMGQPQHMRNWLNPITTEHIVKKLNAEMKLAMQQSQDLARARQMLDHMLSGSKSASPLRDSRPNSEKSRPSPTQPPADLKPQFFEPPPAPPPQAPLPEKPDVLRALADPLIRPLLRREETAHPGSNSSSPTRPDHSMDILRLCEELKLAKGELTTQSSRMRTLETELALERTARESAEERALRFERRDSPTSTGEHDDAEVSPTDSGLRSPPVDLQLQLDRLRQSMDEMKAQMESYRRRAETAEGERDEARVSLAEMVEAKRRENSEQRRSPSRARKAEAEARGLRIDDEAAKKTNGHVIASALPGSPTSETLLERAGIEEGRPITQAQAKMLTQFLTQEILGVDAGRSTEGRFGAQYGAPYGSAAAVVLLGVMVMTWVNGWPRVER